MFGYYAVIWDVRDPAKIFKKEFFSIYIIFIFNSTAYDSFGNEK